MNPPAEIERSFRTEFPVTEFAIQVKPGMVSFPAVKDLCWEEAHRLSVEIRDAAQAARTLLELDEARACAEVPDEAPAPAPAEVPEAYTLICTTCREPIRAGCVSFEDEADPSKRRHAEGSPECPSRR